MAIAIVFWFKVIGALMRYSIQNSLYPLFQHLAVFHEKPYKNQLARVPTFPRALSSSARVVSRRDCGPVLHMIDWPLSTGFGCDIRYRIPQTGSPMT